MVTMTATCRGCGEGIVFLVASNYQLWKHADGLTKDHHADPIPETKKRRDTKGRR